MKLIILLAGETTVVQLESWTTGEEFCKDSLAVRGLDSNELDGWTVTLNDDNDSYELMGNDYVLDLISEMEVPPAFPVCKSFFLVSTDITKDGTQNHKRRSMTAGSNNPDSVYDWYFEMHQTENTADRLVLTKAIKGNSSNQNVEPPPQQYHHQQQQDRKIKEVPASKPPPKQKPEKPILKSSSYINGSSSNISNAIVSHTSTASVSNNNSQKPTKPILKHEKTKNVPIPPKRINKPSFSKSESVEIKSKNTSTTNNCQQEKSIKKPVQISEPNTNTNSNTKSIGRKRLSKPKVLNVSSESKSRMYTLNKSKKGTLGNSRKQNFRFRFEPNKSTLTKIVMKDSLKSRSAINPNFVEQGKPKPKQYSKSGYQIREEKSASKNSEVIVKDKKRPVQNKAETYEEIDKNYEDRAYR